MWFERLIFLRRVSLIYQSHFLILLNILCPNFWKMLLLNFVFFLMLSHNNLIQILWAPDRHCFDSLPCSICTLAIEGGLVQHHFAIAVLVRHIWRVTNKLAWICWPMHVLVHAYWIITRVIFLSKLLSDSTIFKGASRYSSFSDLIIEWTLLLHLLSMHLGVTRCLFVVFCLDYPIIRRWRREWSKSLINLLSCLEVLIR